MKINYLNNNNNYNNNNYNKQCQISIHKHLLFAFFFCENSFKTVHKQKNPAYYHFMFQRWFPLLGSPLRSYTFTIFTVNINLLGTYWATLQSARLSVRTKLWCATTLLCLHVPGIRQAETSSLSSSIKIGTYCIVKK